MITIYCKGNHQENLCSSCQQLSDYVDKRINLCPLMESKTFCSNYPIHCYSKEMQEQIKVVMRYAGPRMIFHHPLLLVDQSYQSIKHKLKRKKEIKSGK